MDPGSNIQPLSKKTNFETDEDRISNLPKEVIGHILSFLPTKDALRTSILSSSWDKKWTWIPNLYFTDESFNLKYMSYIDRVLSLHTLTILRFHLLCTPQIIKSHLNDWISCLLKRGIRELDLSSHFEEEIVFPKEFFTCSTLVIFKTDMYFVVPSLICLPSLKVLHIWLHQSSHDLIKKLLCSCPVLEELAILVKLDSGKSMHNISSLMLKSLCIDIRSYGLEPLDITVTISAPSLEFLDIRCDCFVYYHFKNCSSFSKAYVNVDFFNHDGDIEDTESADQLVMLLVAISHVKNLSLGPLTVCAFGYNIETYWPEFPNLTHLQLEAGEFDDPYCYSNWPQFSNVIHLILDVMDFGSKSLSNILTVVPNLASLVLKSVPILNSSLNNLDPCEEGVPTCLLSCLKKIEVCKQDGSESALELIKYLLENARVLETMTIEVTHGKLCITDQNYREV